MKKSYAIVSLLMLAAACTAPPTNREAAPINSAATATPTSMAISETEVIAKEKAIWDAIKNKDYETFGNMLAEDQIEVLPEEVRDKAASIAGVKEFEPTEITFSDWKYLPIDKDAVVLAYHVDLKGKSKGKEFPPQSVRASSAWVNRNGKWLAAFHQECVVSTAPSPQPAAGSSPAKTSATPPSTPTPATTGADPVATEKALWETLKSKNYDGFAAFLAADAIEVEPTGVYDKAGTVSAVRQFDFSKAQLSEFKSVPFDMDAELVTYLLKIPGPGPAERHSTIWAKRNGKWLAVFHHGTPISRATATATPSPKSAAATPSPKSVRATPSPN
ncbi:MAG: nuclear transport factor 2 family protein [Pyrinomonadaceae bacterium]|nr:nuclear transport factor 2 family protein [Pyrinomonadaceae bacterium]